MIDWVAEKLKQVESIGEAVISGLVSTEIAEKRYSICMECEYLKNKKCKICNCHMPAKVLFKTVECPKNYWRD